jgi:glutamate/tyrosine decarboxylase-like PLP-dependent enzyme
MLRESSITPTNDPNHLRKQITELEQRSRLLEPSPQEYEQWVQQAARFASTFLSELPGMPAAVSSDPALIREQVPLHPTSFEALLEFLSKHVLTRGLNAASGRYVAYVPGGGLSSAAIGDFLAALTNRYSGNYGACPPAAEIENICVQWLMEMVGFPQTGWGILTSGGTIAALTALVAARNTRPASDWGKSVVYMTSETHHSIPKVLGTIGLANVVQRLVPVDCAIRMDVSALRTIMDQDRANGLIPWIICATAGTTNTGAIDPMGLLADLAKERNLWLHVDGAYGGLFALTREARPRLADIERADSLVLDPHKSLFLPYGCGAVLVANRKLLKSSFTFHPDYLVDLRQDDLLSPSDCSIEGTRHFRGLRMWLSLKLHGLETIRAALEEKILLAQYAHYRLGQIKGVETGPFPQLSCVTFRLANDDSTQRLLERMQTRGSIYPSSTRLNGSLYIRFCIVHFRTHLAEIERGLEEVRSLTAEL